MRLDYLKNCMGMYNEQHEDCIPRKRKYSNRGVRISTRLRGRRASPPVCYPPWSVPVARVLPVTVISTLFIYFFKYGTSTTVLKISLVWIPSRRSSRSGVLYYVDAYLQISSSYLLRSPNLSPYLLLSPNLLHIFWKRIRIESRMGIESMQPLTATS